MSQTDPVIVDVAPFHVEEAELFSQLQMTSEDVFADDVRRLADAARSIGRPKGVYKLAAVEPQTDDTILIDEVLFTSHVLSVNLKDVRRAFPFIATCGRELDAWSASLHDFMEQYWADAIKEAALLAAISALGDHLANAYGPSKRATMNPGSLDDWPISQQRQLFSLFDTAAQDIGVELSESCLMNPIKSVSGIWFQADGEFVNCQLCPRENCPNRSAPYDPHLFATRYKM
jgi:hypothetical protein